ncbi:MAG: hypothetical protein PHC41_09130 [Lachnospiraceae bacterium]|nr:hypothetical protein [Lachnospiraceae bacterium]MDD3616372.1 hypothetical protein [Lachnospiraceae bacterium]
MGIKTSYFAGGNTAYGFCSYFPYILPEAEQKQVYYIKGGPGVGKSTLMKQIGKRMEEAGYRVEYFFCSGDPASLDAVAVPALGAALMDGTAPHIYDPAIPGARDTLVSLGDYLREEQLRTNQDKIIRISREISEYYQQCYAYLGGAGKLMEDSKTCQASPKSIYACAQSLKEKLKDTNPSDDVVRHLFGDAYTFKGLVSFVKEIPAKYKYALANTERGLCHAILKELYQMGRKERRTMVVLHDPLYPSLIAHLYFPLESVLYTSDDSCGEAFPLEPVMCDFKKTKTLDVFSENMSQQLIGEAVKQLKLAKTAHDKLEAYYVESMDFESLNERREEIIDDLLGAKESHFILK